MPHRTRQLSQQLADLLLRRDEMFRMTMTGPSDAASPLYTRLRRALPSAMKARDHAAVAALRSAVAAIDNAQAVEGPPAPRSGGVIAGAVTGLGAGDVPRRELSEDEIAAIVSAELADRRTAAADYERAGQVDAAARLTAEADVLAAHLADVQRLDEAGGRFWSPVPRPGE